MDVAVATSTFSLLFLAEFGDKSQLVAITLAHRYRPLPVLAGTFLAFFALNVLAVTAGEALALFLNRNLVLLAAGALFMGFAVVLWRGADHVDPPAEVESRGRQALATSFVLIFVAELGDKTQISLVTMAAKYANPLSVFVGGTLALWAVCLLGVLAGSRILRRVPVAWIHRAAAVLFLAFGLTALTQALIGLRA